MTAGAYLMAYFTSEAFDDGEQVRLAVSDLDDPTRWTPLRGGQPVLTSTVGERGVRDPFLIRHPHSGRIFIIATDLRVAADGDWDRAVREGSRNVVVWWTDDLRAWDGPHLVSVSPKDAGNTWAPKAVWSAERNAFLVIWASARYPEGRSIPSHQRLLAAATEDFISFGPAFTYLDPGHDVIDAAFLEHDGVWYRFSANAHGQDKNAGIGHHIFIEKGTALEDPSYRSLRVDVGKPELARGEGPAVFADRSGGFFLLIDEFALRGYQLFQTSDLTTGEWEHIPHAQLPTGARHGSVLAIGTAERKTLLETP
ncbi:glycoside hydrolase family 43 protein [Microbacterium sp. 22215]|uniref:glycoside hydrolase family 43 protein n=1 Tax=Microbacterium sp. 22215 TaxID=3453893 RepID=UPI003F8456ED